MTQERANKQTENSKGPRAEKVTKKRSIVKSVPKQTRDINEETDFSKGHKRRIGFLFKK